MIIYSVMKIYKKNQVFNENYASEGVPNKFLHIDVTSSNKNFEMFVKNSSFLTP